MAEWDIVFRTSPGEMGDSRPVGLVYMGVILRVPEIATDMVIDCAGRKTVIRACDIREARDRAGLAHIMEPGPWSSVIMNLPEVVVKVTTHIEEWGSLRALGCVSMSMFRIVTEVEPIRLMSERIVNMLVAAEEWKIMARCRVAAKGSDESYRKACQTAKQTGSPDVWFTALKIYGDKYGLIDTPWVPVPRDAVIAIHKLYPRKLRFLRDRVGALMVKDFCQPPADVEVLHILCNSGYIRGVPLDMYILTGHCEDIRSWNVDCVLDVELLKEPRFMEWLKDNPREVYGIKTLLVDDLPEDVRKVWWDTHGIK